MEELKRLLDKIVSYLAEGEVWHGRCANEARKFYITRGWGRWHEAEALCDGDALIKLSKLSRDNLNHTATINITDVQRASVYTMADFNAFKQSHDQWIARENMFITTLNEAVQESRTVNMEIYEYLCGLLAEVQNESMRVTWVKGSCDMNSWAPHDVKVTSKWLHDYFEHEYKGKKIDFNIG